MSQWTLPAMVITVFHHCCLYGNFIFKMNAAKDPAIILKQFFSLLLIYFIHVIVLQFIVLNCWEVNDDGQFFFFSFRAVSIRPIPAPTSSQLPTAGLNFNVSHSCRNGIQYGNNGSVDMLLVTSYAEASLKGHLKEE